MPEHQNISRIERYDMLRKLRTMVALGAIAGYGAYAEKLGIPSYMPGMARAAINSFQHPIVGYMGAMAGDILSSGRNRRQKTIAILAGATVANFFTETAQSLVETSSPTASWATHGDIVETLKDYAFDMKFGAGLYLNQISDGLKGNRNVE